MPCTSQKKRSTLGAYWTIWSQQKLGFSSFGLTCVKCWPSLEKSASQFPVMKTVSPSLAPLGSHSWSVTFTVLSMEKPLVEGPCGSQGESGRQGAGDAGVQTFGLVGSPR